MASKITLSLGALFLSANLCLASSDPSEESAGNTSSIVQQAAAESGTIKIVDLEERKIQIDKKVFGLSDSLQVFSSNNHLMSQVSLLPNQKIEYWSEVNPEANLNQLPSKIINKIRIISNYKKSQLQK